MFPCCGRISLSIRPQKWWTSPLPPHRRAPCSTVAPADAWNRTAGVRVPDVRSLCGAIPSPSPTPPWCDSSTSATNRQLQPCYKPQPQGCSRRHCLPFIVFISSCALRTLPLRTVNSRRPGRARNEGTTGPKDWTIHIARGRTLADSLWRQTTGLPDSLRLHAANRCEMKDL